MAVDPPPPHKHKENCSESSIVWDSGQLKIIMDYLRGGVDKGIELLLRIEFLRWVDPKVLFLLRTPVGGKITDKECIECLTVQPLQLSPCKPWVRVEHGGRVRPKQQSSLPPGRPHGLEQWL